MNPGFRWQAAYFANQTGLTVLILFTILAIPRADCRAASVTNPPAIVTARSGGVEFQTNTLGGWYFAPTNHPLFEGDHLHTLADGRATLRMWGWSDLRLNPRTELLITPARSATAKGRIEVRHGLLYFLDRNRPGEIDVDTPLATAAIEGTEFEIAVNESDGATVLTMLDGRVTLSNRFGGLTITNGEQATVDPEKAPRRTAVISAKNLVQWCLYYPAVLDPQELNLDAGTQTALSNSLAAYREGDLPGALAQYPSGRMPRSAAESIYHASLLLSAGLVTNNDDLIPAGAEAEPNALALRYLLAAVGANLLNLPIQTNNASQWLGYSYHLQSRHDLSGALAAADCALAISPNFAFALARRAELEFSSGRVPEAQVAIERSLNLAPRNAQAVVLRGFLLLARDRVDDAKTEFEKAMQLDPMLANAWLGRGLALIHEGHVLEGRADLQTAAVLEPERWLLRSYLGKAYAHEMLYTHDAALNRELRSRAQAELELAKRSDPLDPTPRLYSALLAYDEYRSAAAIHELEESSRLNDNRQVYRSRLLLDEDMAVRSANLANVFQDAGMADVSVRESARAVDFDYANFSAHLNLASSFNALRDPARFNLRFESEWFNEHLLASLLAPGDAGSLSQNLSQQEYSRLFTGPQLALSGTTEYFSNGELRQSASQSGTYGGSSYALDMEYQHKDGDRVNNDLNRLEWYSRLKQQLTPEDSVLLLVKYQDYNAGDNFQYYNPASASPTYRLTETQSPVLLAGWHHEWGPGVHTLFVAGRLENEQRLQDDAAPQRVAAVIPSGFIDPRVVPFDVRYHNEFEIYTAELNQIFQGERHTDIFGVRWQHGTFQANASLDNPPAMAAGAFATPVLSVTDATFRRVSFYAYHHWEIIDHLLLIGGLAHDDLVYPSNFRRPPLNSDESIKQRWLPKAALIWNAVPGVTMRGVFAKALGGVSYDESVRLEPTQLAGFGQSFRSLISESLIGSVEAPDYQIIGGALDLKLHPNTWLTLQAESLEEKVGRESGLFFYNLSAATPPPPTFAASTTEDFDYHELNLRATLNQIIGQDWFLEAGYQFSRSELETTLPTIPATPTFSRSTTVRADLQEIRLAANWRDPSGWFALGELNWFKQSLGGSAAQPPGDAFPQLNFFAGYRFPRRLGEIAIGLLNATDRDYQLSPLNYYLDMPHERTFYSRFRFNF